MRPGPAEAAGAASAMEANVSILPGCLSRGRGVSWPRLMDGMGWGWDMDVEMEDGDLRDMAWG